VLLGGGVGFGGPTTKPATTGHPGIAEAIGQLGDGDYRVRERAARELWAAGRDAEPALQKATRHPNPEVARRARAILSNLALGLTPDMSPEVIGLLTTYRNGDAVVKQRAAEALAEQGAAGARVLLTLRARAANGAEAEQISKLFWRSGRDMAIALIGDDDTPMAKRVLAAAVEGAEQDTTLPMHYAALLAAAGGLDDAIKQAAARLDQLKVDAAKMERDAPVPPPAAAVRAKREPPRVIRDASWELYRTARLLTVLRRANGDLAGARDAAELADSPPLLRNILIEIGDWKTLARMADDDVDDRAGVEELSFAAAFHRLSGDDAGADKYARQLRVLADRQPEASWDVAEGLFLNGQVDLGLDVLGRGDDLATAVEFAAHRLAFDRVSPFVATARGRDAPGLRRVEAAAAEATWYAGDAQTAAASLDGIAKECERRRDLSGFAAVVDAGAQIGLTDRVRWYVVSALQLVATQPALVVVQPGNPAAAAAAGPLAPDRADPLRFLFAKARLHDPAAAAAWWSVLRERFPKQPAGRTFETIRAIDEKRIKRDELAAMCEASAADALKRPPEVRDAELELIAATLDAFGQREASTKFYEQLADVADRSSPARATAARCKLAAFDADAGRWRQSAEGYFRAWSRDRADPVPLYLSGISLVQAGEKSLGRQRIEQAHVLPLADENRRHALYQFLLDRKLNDEARRERELILRTSAFLSWPRSDALRRAGDEAYAAGDAAKAADLWERAFLDNNSTSTGFVEPWANLAMPALVRRTRAVALIKAGKVDAGLKEADVSLAMSPADADTLIEIVAALEASKHKTEADALYKRVMARYARLSADHPQSSPLHNLCAWAAAKCGRDLDAALVHARSAVQIQPKNTAAIDTLAETHFQRREYSQAIAAMQKCVELEPDDPSHKQKLERFRKAAAVPGSSTKPVHR
jgi:tetratricopeptide (TPR) repeat protein